LTYINIGIILRLKDERTEDGETYEYNYDISIKSYDEELNKSKEVLTEEVIYLDSSREDVEVEIAMQYHKGFSSNVLTYANNIHTYEGGTHEEGFRRALTRVINNYGFNQNILKENDERLSGEDVRE